MRPPRGRGCPTSSSSGTPRAAPPRCTRCSAATRRSSCPTSRSRSSSPRDLRRARHAAAAGGPPETLEEYLSLFSAAGPEQLAGEASPSYLWSRDRRRRAIAEVQPAARIIAILREPASFLHSLHLQLLQNRRRDREGPAHGDRARARAARGQARPGTAALARRRCATPSGCATSSSCAATTRAFAPRAGAGPDLRRLPRATTTARCARCCASSKSTRRTPLEPIEANPSVAGALAATGRSAARDRRSGAVRCRVRRRTRSRR